MKPLTEDEQEALTVAQVRIGQALSALRRSGITDEDIEVARARLENWLVENDGRWVA